MNEALQAKIAAAAGANPHCGDSLFPTPDYDLELHVDGDYAAYFCAGNDDTAPGIARKTLLERLENARQMSGAYGRTVVHLSSPTCDKGNRFIIATVKPYQGQRGGRKPKNWEFLRDFMTTYEGAAFRPKVWQQREADDGIAYMSWLKKIVIYTRDKDMRMLRGIHLDWMDWQLTTVEAGDFDVIGPNGLQYGHKWFWQQMLQGDTADNIPGLPRHVTPDKPNGVAVGEATAAKLLADVTDNESACYRVGGLYKAYYKDEWADRFVEQAALLWLRHDAGASPRDFLRVVPLTPPCDPIREAADRLVTRVEAGLAEINSFTD